MIRQSQRQEGQFASFEDRTGSIGDQMEELHPHAVRRLYLAIVNRAILDVLENGRESREAKRWLLSRDFDSLQAAVD